MVKTSIKSIYQWSNELKDQIALFTFMKRKERNTFVNEIRTLIDAARQAEQNTTSQQTKSRLQNIIEAWEKFLVDSRYIPIRNLPVISKVDKISQGPTAFPEKEVSTAEALHRFSTHIARLTSHILSLDKVDPNSPVFAPLDPALRAIYDELSGTVDSI